MNVNPLGGHHRPSHLTPTAPGSRLAPTRPRPEVEVDAEAIETASSHREERRAQRAERYEARLDHIIEDKLERVDAKIARFVERHELSEEDVADIDEYRARFEETLTELRSTLAADGFEPGSIAAFRDGVKEALRTLRESVRGVLQSDPAENEIEVDPAASGEPVPVEGEVDPDEGAAAPVEGETDPVATPVDGEVAAGGEAEPIDTTPGLSEETDPVLTVTADLTSALEKITSSLEEITDALEEITIAIDEFADLAQVSDAFDSTELVLPDPAVDIQA